jgi:hypothetical protein
VPLRGQEVHTLSRLQLLQDAVIITGVFDVFQIPYSAVEREHECERAASVRPVCRGEAPPGRRGLSAIRALVPDVSLLRGRVHVVLNRGVERFEWGWLRRL